MIPYVIPQLPLLFGTVLLFLIAIGSLECAAISGENQNCGTSKIKSVELHHKLSSKYLRIYNSLVVADAENYDKHTLYTITVIRHAFVIYDPEAAMFICFIEDRNNKTKLVARRNPNRKMLETRCAFEESSLAVGSAFTRYELYNKDKIIQDNNKSNKTEHFLNFNKKGLRRLHTKSIEGQLFTKKLTDCSLAYERFCKKVKNASRRRKRVYEYFKKLCN